ncbi:MAG: hypothetical protein PVG90_08255 [Bacillota bacterium]|jgi:hypothetical protein
MNATIIINYKKNPSQLFLWQALNVVIDGKDKIRIPPNHSAKMNIQAGKHLIQMSFSYFGFKAGKTEVDLEIKAKETMMLTYKTPPIIMLPGTVLAETKKQE